MMNVTTATPNYEAFAIRYATVERRASATFLSWNEPDRPVALDFFFWVIRGNGHCIVVDTGFSEYSSHKRNRPFGFTPVRGLEKLGVDPLSVSDVILTHLHYDHAGNTDLFPNAHFHLQASEMAFACGPLMRHRLLREHYEVRDLARLLELNFEGRLCLLEGDNEIVPGVSVHPLPGHTPGVQGVLVSTDAGPTLIAADGIHYYANLDNGNPFPAVVDVAVEFQSYERAMALAGSRSRIVAGHDPEVLLRFSPLSSEYSDIVRLHQPLGETC